MVFLSLNIYKFWFFPPRTAHFYDSIAIPFLVFKIFGLTLFVSFLHFQKYVNILGGSILTFLLF